MAVDRQGYLGMLQALLPRGRAWPRDPEATLTRLLEALAVEPARLDGRAEALLDEIDPRQTTELLGDWERVAGLPDDCSPLAGTHAARRAAVVVRLAGQAASTPAAMVAIAASLGVVATVREHDRTAAERIPGLDTSDGRWRYVWWLDVQSTDSVRHLDVLGGVDEPLATWGQVELECRIRAVSPAHTHVVFTYR